MSVNQGKMLRPDISVDEVINSQGIYGLKELGKYLKRIALGDVLGLNVVVEGLLVVGLGEDKVLLVLLEVCGEKGLREGF